MSPLYETGGVVADADEARMQQLEAMMFSMAKREHHLAFALAESKVGDTLGPMSFFSDPIDTWGREKGQPHGLWLSPPSPSSLNCVLFLPRKVASFFAIRGLICCHCLLHGCRMD
jgi:hypothetical protein